MKPPKKTTTDGGFGPLAGIVLSSLEAATLILLTRARLYELVQAGWIKAIAPNRYDPAEVAQGYIRFLKDEERRTSKTATLSRVQEARARQIEQRTARDAGQTIAMADALALLDDVVGGLKADLDGVPARCTRDMVERRKLEAELNDCLTRAANRLDQEGDLLKAGIEVDPTEAAIDA
jgi:phage terminase Nu1 subunit (DNA packaging protein)